MTRLSLQPRLFDLQKFPRIYGDSITASVNRKGCMDIDTVKGCAAGMTGRPDGCYGECYARKIAHRYGIEFGHSVKRGFVDQWQHRDILVRQLRAHHLPWYRVGVMGDPSHDWSHTISVIAHLRPADSTAVIVTKHWRALSDEHLSRLRDLDVVVQTSTSGLDTDAETKQGRDPRQRHSGDSQRSVASCGGCDEDRAGA